MSEKQSPKEKQNNYAIGHRERMRSKYLEEGAGAFHDYQLLEMALFYSIPQKDVKGLAKRLIEEFGSLENVLGASPQQLMRINGVGERTAVLLRLMRDINKSAAKTRMNYKEITNYEMALDYFKNMFELEENEKFAVLFFDNKNKPVFSKILSEGIVNTTQVPIRLMTQYAIDSNASNIMIAHNHPHGSAKPSAADIEVTLNIRNFMKTIGVRLIDHIIVGETEILSMRSMMEYNTFFEDKDGKRRS